MNDVMLIIHFIGLAMGVGTGFAFMFLGMAGSKMEKAEAQRFQLNTLTLSRMGHIGLTLMIVSGVLLMPPYWKVLFDSPLLITKLVLVLILTALVLMVHASGQKARKGEPENHLKAIDLLGKIVLLISVATLVLAVYIFH